MPRAQDRKVAGCSGGAHACSPPPDHPARPGARSPARRRDDRGVASYTTPRLWEPRWIPGTAAWVPAAPPGRPALAAPAREPRRRPTQPPLPPASKVTRTRAASRARRGPGTHRAGERRAAVRTAAGWTELAWRPEGCPPRRCRRQRMPGGRAACPGTAAHTCPRRLNGTWRAARQKPAPGFISRAPAPRPGGRSPSVTRNAPMGARAAAAGARDFLAGGAPAPPADTPVFQKIGRH